MKKMMIPILFISLFLIPGKGFALSCVEPPPMEVAYTQYDAVLIGSVDEVKSGLGKKKFTIDVERSFKGVDEKSVTVYEDITWGETQAGSTLLFFLNKDGGSWIHPLCSPTTHDTALADEFFSEREEIVLQDVKSVAGFGEYMSLTVLAIVLLLGAAAVFWYVTAKRRTRRGRG